MLGGNLFKDLPETELRRLVAIARRRRFARGEVVFHDEDPADSLHLIVSGYFAARLETQRGDAVTMSIHGPGDAFGELALLEKAPRNSTIVAESDMELVVLGQREFAGLIDEVPGFARKLLAGMAHRLRDADARSVQ